MNKLVGRALLSVCLGAGAASLAIGQTNAPNSTAPAASAPAPKGEHHFFSHFFSHGSPTERMEARLIRMKGKLEITAAQQAQWDAYANVLRKTAQERGRLGQTRTAHRSGDQRPNAIERLEREQSLRAEAGTRLNELLAVEKPLYAALSPEQKKVADKVLNRSIGGHGGRRMAFWSRHGHERFGRG
jgi:protein CpxP